MATLIKMVCTDCGYVSPEICYGPTFSNFRNLGPALDTSTGTIVQVDLDTIDHPNIIPYTDLRLQDKQVQHSMNGMESGHYFLQLHNNFCPSCNGFFLSVEAVMMID